MPGVSDASALLGKSLDDKDVKKFLAGVDPAGEIEDFQGKTFWTSKKGGLELHADAKTHRILVVMAHGGGFENYKQFKGPLPPGLGISLSQKQLTQALGTPLEGDDSYAAWRVGTIDAVAHFFENGTLQRFVFMPA